MKAHAAAVHPGRCAGINMPWIWGPPTVYMGSAKALVQPRRALRRPEEGTKEDVLGRFRAEQRQG